MINRLLLQGFVLKTYINLESLSAVAALVIGQATENNLCEYN